MLKLKMMLCVGYAAAGRRLLHIKAVCQLQCVKYHVASGVDNGAALDWQTPLNGDYHPQRELTTQAKTTGRNRKVY